MQQQSFITSGVQEFGQPFRINANRDLDDLIKSYNHSQLVSGSRLLFANNGIVKGAVLQKAQYSVSNSYAPKYRGSDKSFGVSATEYLETWLPICNTKGVNFSFKKTLELCSIELDVAGEVFILLIKPSKRTPVPRIQLIPSHRISGDAETISDNSRYSGLRLINGLVISKKDRTVAYRVTTGPNAQDYLYVAKNNLLHYFDPLFTDQRRGLPVFSHAIADFEKLVVSEQYELIAQQIMSSITTIEHNPEGLPDDGDLYDTTPSTTDSKPEPLSMERVEGGTMKYFKAGTDSKLETLTNDRPTANWQEFQNRVTRKALIGAGWSYSILVNFDGRSVADRSEMAKAKKAVERRQTTLDQIAHRIILHGLVNAPQFEQSITPQQLLQWTFSHGKKLSIDYGRDVTGNIALYREGIINLSELVEENGKTLEEHLRETHTEEAMRLKIKDEVEQKWGVQINDERVRKMDLKNNKE